MSYNDINPDPSEGPGRVFRPRPYYRNLGIGGCLLFPTAAVFSLFVAWREPPGDGPINGLILLAGVLGCMAGISAWTLLAYLRERLAIQGGTIVQQGVVHRQQISLTDVTEARWDPVRNGGQIVLSARPRKMRIYLDNFEPAEQLWLIRFFRRHLPEPVQHNWDLFCYKRALPLRRRTTQRECRPGPDEVLFTRRRWDWYFVPLTVASAVYGLVMYWMFDEPYRLLAPLPLAALWLTLRFSIPEEGMCDKRISAQPGLRPFLLFLLCWMAVGIGGVAVSGAVDLPMPYAAIAAAAAMILWSGGFMLVAHRADRQRQRHDREAARSVGERWEKAEGGPLQGPNLHHGEA